MADAFPPHAKTVLVTGATTGIGDAIAPRWPKRDTGSGGLDARRGHPRATGPRRARHRAARRHRPGVRSAAIATVIAAVSGLDAVVNNAGIGMMGAMGDTTEEELLSVYRTNVVGLHTVSRAAIPHLISHPRGTSCTWAAWPAWSALPFRGVYCSSKAAVELIAEAQSMELARHGVKVTVLRPGDFKPRSTTTA